MKLHVETRLGPHGDPEPHSFMLGAHRLTVDQIIDRWLSSDHGYFEWELTLFQSTPAN